MWRQVHKTVVALAASLIAFTSPAAVNGSADTRSGIFDPAFRSMQIYQGDNRLGFPIANLGSYDTITLSFDELAEDRRYLRYRLIHCNADWSPSQLVESEYIDGFNIADIEDYALSQATTVHYVNYRLSLPNKDMTPMLSGNYLIQVFDENNPDETLLQARFMLNEGTAAIESALTSRTDIDYNDSHQQLSVTVDTERSGVADPFNDLRVVIVQNGRTDNMASLQQPLRISGKKAVYEHLRPLIFPAGNEYRRMETVSVHYPGMGVDEIAYSHPYYHIRLMTDSLRNDTPYTYDSTQHGRYVIREYNSADPDTEADYAITHFSLQIPEQSGADIYLDGDFTRRRFDAESRMTYDPAAGAYTKAVLLKQGAYNYQYLAVPKGASTGYTSAIEGDKYQTVNEYLILVYHRAPMSRYDRLIGVSVLYSGH